MTAPLWLRIIQINDVYELDFLPNLKTLMEAHRDGPTRTIVVLAGDFLGPSLLSSLDQGASMIDCLNLIGIDYVCIGNHETDVDDLAGAIRQSNFSWINTNMRELDDRLGVTTVKYEILELENGTNSRRVGFLGLLTPDPSLYRPTSFGGAKIEPVIQTSEAMLTEHGPQADLWIPLTHQSIQEDRIFAEYFGRRFPMVIGGHDHEVFDETVLGARILKTGHDAMTAGVIDIRWTTDEQPLIGVKLVPTTDYAPDPVVQQRVQVHHRILQELETARLFAIEDWKLSAEEIFSTTDNRLGPSSGTRVLCSMLRMGLQCQCAVINAGCVRGNKVYDDTDYFTWGDLKAEMPFATHMTACRVPGRVLEATIRHSRQDSRLDPPIARGGYLHECHEVVYDNETESIVSINGRPFDPDAMYLTAMPTDFFEGIDNHEPLLAWHAEAHPVDPATGKVPLCLEPDSALPAKHILVGVLSSLLWLELGSFDQLDDNHDGVLTKDEVQAHVRELYGADVSDIVTDNIFSIADLNGNGTVTKLEMMLVQCVASQLGRHRCPLVELRAMRAIAMDVLDNESATKENVRALVKQIQELVEPSSPDWVRGDNINRVAAQIRSLGPLKRTELL